MAELGLDNIFFFNISNPTAIIIKGSTLSNYKKCQKKFKNTTTDKQILMKTADLVFLSGEHNRTLCMLICSGILEGDSQEVLLDDTDNITMLQLLRNAYVDLFQAILVGPGPVSSEQDQ